MDVSSGAAVAALFSTDYDDDKNDDENDQVDESGQYRGHCDCSIFVVHRDSSFA